MNLEDFSQSAIKDYNNGGLANGAFLAKAHQLYNAYATYSCDLPNAKFPYLHGIVFSKFAKYYSNNIDYYTSIAENALYCFSNITVR